ncbi:unnamed protein product, partial [marine sediment metagenome]
MITFFPLILKRLKPYAASIDGANAWQKFRYVTLPCIRNIIIVMVTIHVLWTFNNFDFVYRATGGGPV